MAMLPDVVRKAVQNCSAQAPQKAGQHLLRCLKGHELSAVLCFWTCSFARNCKSTHQKLQPCIYRCSLCNKRWSAARAAHVSPYFGCCSFGWTLGASSSRESRSNPKPAGDLFLTAGISSSPNSCNQQQLLTGAMEYAAKCGESRLPI